VEGNTSSADVRILRYCTVRAGHVCLDVNCYIIEINWSRIFSRTAEHTVGVYVCTLPVTNCGIRGLLELCRDGWMPYCETVEPSQSVFRYGEVLHEDYMEGTAC
jgi:hypothetical protein